MKVEILKPSKTVTQSGKGGDFWVLRFVKSDDERQINPLMGWCSVNNTNSQIKLRFNRLEEAIAYAKENGFEFKVIDPKKAVLKRKSYADNFT